MSREKLDAMINLSRSVVVTPEQREDQRRSFAYGNAKFENPRISRSSIDKAASELASKDAKKK